MMIDRIHANQTPDTPVIFSSSELFYIQTQFVIYSIIQNLKSNSIPKFFILLAKESKLVRQSFQSFSEVMNLNIEIICLEDRIEIQPQIRSYPKETLLRLSLQNIFIDYSKVLYLDSDIHVRDDISELLNFDIGEYSAAVVMDGLPDYKGTSGSYRKAIGMTSTDLYFNGGVMLINLDKWRQIDVLSKAKEWFSEKENQGLFADQDPLNVILEGKLFYFPARWNLQTTLLNSILYKGKIASDFRIEYINAKIIHYAGDLKPWSSKAYLPFIFEYRNSFSEFKEKVGLDYLIPNYDPYFYLSYINHFIKRFRAVIRSQFRNEFIVPNTFGKT